MRSYGLKNNNRHNRCIDRGRNHESFIRMVLTLAVIRPLKVNHNAINHETKDALHQLDFACSTNLLQNLFVNSPVLQNKNI